MRLELDAPNVGELEKKCVCGTIDSGFVSTFGPNVTKFEEKFAEYLGSQKLSPPKVEQRHSMRRFMS